MIGVIFIATPIMLRLLYFISGKKHVICSDVLPMVSIVLVVRNAEATIESKIKNTLSLQYPHDKLEIIIFSDGSTDETEQKAKAFTEKNVRIFSSSAHEGKNNGINEAVKKCSGEILVFTDADVILDTASLLKIVKYFGDPLVGGICGNKVVVKDNSRLEDAQDVYTKLSGSIKWLESQIGSISSNDGTLYGIRKELFRELPPAVTDDLYVCLSVIRQNYRYMFEPEARAYMSAPSVSPAHEIRRRRRIVSTSLRGIFLLKEVLNPFKYGAVAISLFINKVLRRLLPVFLITLFLSSAVLSPCCMIVKTVLAMQTAFYLLALLYVILFQHLPKIKLITKISSLSFYFCVGNYGTLLGLIDFFSGKRTTKW